MANQITQRKEGGANCFCISDTCVVGLVVGKETVNL